jgi:hypothetical protein
MKKLALALLLSASSAAAEDRRMIIINHSSEAIIGLAGSPIDKPKWDYNMLAGDAIPVGSRRLADFDDGTGYCRYDLVATGAAGGRWEHYNVNVCSIETWTLR